MTGKLYQADFRSRSTQMVVAAAANPIHNGGFNVWQRGTTFTSVANGAYTADRWLYLKSGTTAVHDALQSTDVPAIATLVPNTSYSMHLDVTTADASIAAGDICRFQQRIEGYVFAPFWQQQLSIGFWVKDTITGTHAVSLVNAGSDRACVMEYTVNAADTWEYQTVTFPVSPSAGTWDFTTGVGAFLSFPLAVGASFQTTAGVWQAGSSFHGTSNTVNSLSSTSNNFKLWGVTLGLGTTVAPFWPRSFGEEEGLCKRYYEALLGGSSGHPFAVGLSVSTSSAHLLLSYETKRAAPTLTNTALANFTVFDTAGGTPTSFAPDGITTQGARLIVNVSGTPLTTGNAAYLYDGAGSAQINVSADL